MLKCLTHPQYEPAVRPSNRCVHCWVVWFEKQGRFGSIVDPADLACFLRDLFEIINPEVGRHLVDGASR